MSARCVNPAGAPVTRGQEGRCEVHVPAFRLTLPNGNVFNLEAFDIGRDDATRPGCFTDLDCSFTNYNFYRIRPRAESVPYAGSYQNLSSVRSLSNSRYTSGEVYFGGTSEDAIRNSMTSLITNVPCRPGMFDPFTRTGDDNSPCQTRPGVTTTIAEYGTTIQAREYAITTGPQGELSRSPGANQIGTPTTRTDLLVNRRSRPTVLVPVSVHHRSP